MSVVRVAALLVVSFLLLGFLHAEVTKPEILKVTVQDLNKDPEKYHRKLIQIEGILESDPKESLMTQVQRTYLRMVEADGLAITSYLGQPGVLKGDRVLISGTFCYSQNPSGKSTLRLQIQGPDGKVEKLPKKE
jgi:hypothetical protein